MTEREREGREREKEREREGERERRVDESRNVIQAIKLVYMSDLMRKRKR